MKAFTYIDRRINPQFREDQDRILKLWKDSFDRFGFETKILTEEDSMRHPRYAELLELVRHFPSICQRDYENCCWLRWLAYEQNAPAIFTDWDVINFGLRPEDIPIQDMVSLHITNNPPVIHDTAFGNPGVVYATAIGIADFISHFPEAPKFALPIQNRLHTSHMVTFSRLG